jgi:hypothetical protein
MMGTYGTHVVGVHMNGPGPFPFGGPVADILTFFGFL